jgi:hypothetical protein
MVGIMLLNAVSQHSDLPTLYTPFIYWKRFLHDESVFAGPIDAVVGTLESGSLYCSTRVSCVFVSAFAFASTHVLGCEIE